MTIDSTNDFQRSGNATANSALYDSSHQIEANTQSNAPKSVAETSIPPSSPLSRLNHIGTTTTTSHTLSSDYRQSELPSSSQHTPFNFYYNPHGSPAHHQPASPQISTTFANNMSTPANLTYHSPSSAGGGSAGPSTWSYGRENTVGRKHSALVGFDSNVVPYGSQTPYSAEPSSVPSAMPHTSSSSTSSSSNTQQYGQRQFSRPSSDSRSRPQNQFLGHPSIRPTSDGTGFMPPLQTSPRTTYPMSNHSPSHQSNTIAGSSRHEQSIAGPSGWLRPEMTSSTSSFPTQLFQQNFGSSSLYPGPYMGLGADEADEEEEEEEDEEIDEVEVQVKEEIVDGQRPRKSEKRKMQNRIAQRAFRARTKIQNQKVVKHILEMENLTKSQSSQISEMSKIIGELRVENERLRNAGSSSSGLETPSLVPADGQAPWSGALFDGDGSSWEGPGRRKTITAAGVLVDRELDGLFQGGLGDHSDVVDGELNFFGAYVDGGEEVNHPVKQEVQ